MRTSKKQNINIYRILALRSFFLGRDSCRRRPHTREYLTVVVTSKAALTLLLK